MDLFFKKLIVLPGILFITAILAAAAFVQEAQAVSLGLPQQIGNLYTWALGLGGLAALGVLIFGAILYITSAGNASRQEEAKEWMKGSLIGLMILFGSFFILNTINPELTVLRDLSLPAINNSGSEEGGGSGTTATVVRPFTIPVQRPSCYSYTFNIPDSYTVPEAACPVAPSVAEKGFADTFCDSRNPGTTGETNVHHAIDIFGAEGSPVYAFEGGTIFRLGWNDDGGKRIWIQSEAGLRYYYAHLQKFAPGLTEGKKVAAGELIGYIDRTGNAQDKSPHLHFEIYPPGPFNYGVDAINPKPVLDKLCSVNS